jgi:AraC-like DNA-binding protein
MRRGTCLDYISPVRFSSAAVPARERIGYWRDAMARPYLGVECEPMRDVVFHAETIARPLGACALGSGLVHGATMRRTRTLLGDGQDHFRWNVLKSGKALCVLRGRDIVLSPGEGLLQSYAEAATHSCIESTLDGIRIPRPMLRELLPAADDLVGRALPADDPMLRLLRDYWQAIERMKIPLEGPYQDTLASHLCDLVAMTMRSVFGASADVSGNGVDAALLHRLKSDILRNLGEASVKIEALAARHGLSVRRAQRLFRAEGTSFSRFLTMQRLLRARKVLADPCCAALRIGTIAMECGFGDISTFNRFFRREFGASPSDVRRQAVEARRDGRN